MTRRTFYPFIVAFNVVKRPQDKGVCVITYVVLAINSHSLFKFLVKLIREGEMQLITLPRNRNVQYSGPCACKM